MTTTETLIELSKKHDTFKAIAKEMGWRWDSREYNLYKSTYYKLKRKGRISTSDKRQQEPVQRTIEERVSIDINKAHESAKVREYKDKYSYVLKKLEESEKRFDALIGVKEPVDMVHIEPIVSQSKSEACPVIMLSDWHFEERIDPLTINGLNEYNLDIAAHRWNKCIQNSGKLIHKERHSSDIKQVIIWLGGDFITGYIHEELEESNYLSPTQAVRFAKERIISALKFYEQHGKFERIIVVCNYGNHGRTNKKPRVSTGYMNSYEWMMYKDIEDYFDGNKKFQFVVPNGLFAYVDIYGFMNRFWHGDTIQYGGGIGGLTVPLIKAIGRYNSTIKCDFNFMGHYHQLFEATKDCMVNGSGIGYSAYAQRIGASFERPQQGFKVIDQKHGYTTKLQIFCE